MKKSLWQRLSGSSKPGEDGDEEKLPYSRPSPQQQVPPPQRQLTQPEEERLVEVNGEFLPWEVTIQPHTDDGGDAYYIGDAYEEAKCAGEWAIPSDGMPYLTYVKKISKSLPHLEYLAHWMEVSAAPPKWKFLKKFDDHRAERACRTNVVVLDFNGDPEPTTSTHTDCASLRRMLDTAPETAGGVQTRLVIVEDLSRDVVEELGARYDIDPLFFLSHLGDYLFHNTRDRWVELPDLEVMARQRQHFNLQYLRARYFKEKKAFTDAEHESGAFNVLRRLDSDRSSKRLQNTLLDLKGACVTLTRSKTSFWWKPRKEGEPILAILLVDPTVTSGHPLWRGYRPFEDTPSMHASDHLNVEPRKTLFDDVVYWSKKLTKEDFGRADKDPRCIAMPMFRIVLAEWRTTLKYMSTMLNKIEWEFEKPHWGERPSDVDESLQKLSPWRRNVPSYQAMINEAINRLFPADMRTLFGAETSDWNTPTPNQGVLSLLFDFRLVQQQMNACENRIERIQTVATNSINIEENRRAVQQNNNLARLTFLATIFIPMSFTSSFLSMSPDFTKATETIWLFFVIGVPLTIIALIIVDLSHPQEGVIRRRMRKWGLIHRTTTARPRPKQLSPTQASDKVILGRTIPWSLNEEASRPNT